MYLQRVITMMLDTPLNLDFSSPWPKGYEIRNYSTSAFPFAKEVQKALMERGFIDRETPLDQLHQRLSPKSIRLDQNYFNPIGKSPIWRMRNLSAPCCLLSRRIASTRIFQLPSDSTLPTEPIRIGGFPRSNGCKGRHLSFFAPM